MSRMRRGFAVLGLLAVALTTFAGCGTPLPAPTAEVLAVPPPAVTPTQSQTIASAVGTVLATADAAHDAAALATRLTGPALAMRSAEYVRFQATAGAKAPTALPTTEASAVLPQTTAWPRAYLVITQQPADLGAQRILVLQQASAREQYKLWGWARLFPGVTMPSTAALDVGSPVLADDDADLLVKPADLVTQYADVLANGTASGSAATFASDPYRTAVEASRATNQQQLGASSASYTETYTPAGPPVVALGTLDGGALVVGQITTTSTATAAEGGKLENSDPVFAALAGATPTTSLSWTYTDVLVFYVPRAGAGGQVQAVAAEHLVTAASAS